MSSGRFSFCVKVLLAVGLASTVVAKELPYISEKNGDGPPRLHVQSSPKVELAMLVAASANRYLSINRAMPDNPLGTYWRTNTSQFGSEDAVVYLRQLFARGMLAEALLEFAMHLSEPPALERVFPWSERLQRVADTGRDEDPAVGLDNLLEKFKVYGERVRFDERFAEKKPDYDAIVLTLKEHISGLAPLEANSSFWGVEASGDYYLIPSPMISGGYTATIRSGDRTHQFFGFGPTRSSLLSDRRFLHHLVYHELSHPMIDPIVLERADELESSRDLWTASGATGAGWAEQVTEHLLRAYNIRIMRQDDPVLADLSIQSESTGGFPFTRQFVSMLDEYEAGRDRWPGFEDYFPTMVARLDEMAKNSRDFNPGTKMPSFDLENPGFEKSDQGWLVDSWMTVRGGTVPSNLPQSFSRISRDTTTAHQGEASVRLQVDQNTTDIIALEQGSLAVRAGGSVELSGWVKTENVSRQSLQQRVCGLYVLFLDISGNVLSRGETDSAIGTLDWTKISAEFSAPAGTASMTVGILLGMSGTAWFDGIDIKRID